MSEDRPAPMSDYFRVVHFLAGLKCPGCGGVGGRASSPKPCTFCKGSGFRGEDIHFLVSGKQTGRRG